MLGNGCDVVGGRRGLDAAHAIERTLVLMTRLGGGGDAGSAVNESQFKVSGHPRMAEDLLQVRTLSRDDLEALSDQILAF